MAEYGEEKTKELAQLFDLEAMNDIDDFDYIKYTGYGGQDSPGGNKFRSVFKRAI